MRKVVEMFEKLEINWELSEQDYNILSRLVSDKLLQLKNEKTILEYSIEESFLNKIYYEQKIKDMEKLIFSFKNLKNKIYFRKANSIK